MTVATNQIIYVNRNAFIKAYNDFKKQNHLSTAKVARLSSISPSYLYHIVARNSQRPVTLRAAKIIGKGLAKTANQRKTWHNNVIKTADSSDDDYQPSMFHAKKAASAKASLVAIVKHLMGANEMSVAELAKNSGMDINHVKKFLAGDVSTLSAFDKARLARGLGTDYKHLLSLQSKQVSKAKEAPRSSSQSKAKPQSSASHQSASSASTQSSERASKAPTVKATATQPVQTQTAQLRPDVMTLAKRLNHLSVTDVDIVRLFADRMLDSRMHRNN